MTGALSHGLSKVTLIKKKRNFPHREGNLEGREVAK
jgi:hypothetical protein